MCFKKLTISFVVPHNGSRRPFELRFEFSPLFSRHGLARNCSPRLRKFRLKVARAWHAKLKIHRLICHRSRWFLELSGPADPSRLSATRLTLVLAEVNRQTPVRRMG
jgi:hypothetical protein